MKLKHLLVVIAILALGIYIGRSLQTDPIPIPSQDNVRHASMIDSATNSEESQALKLNEDEKSVINIFEDGAPSVVFITTTQLAQSFFSFDVTEIPTGSGTGFMWDNRGHIVTNYHVIEGGERVSVTLSDQSSYEARVVGVEPSKDLAVLKIEAPLDKLKGLPKSQSGNLKVGQSVYAIGNPFGFDQTLTTGVISALGREITAVNNRKIYDVIQTDAAINPGNSGGPLLNSSGELIGVNTAIYSPSGAYSGIGFSIPVDAVNKVVPDLIEYGVVNRADMGITLLDDRYFREPGAMIKRVYPRSSAEAAGLRGLQKTRRGSWLYGDIIVGIEGASIKNSLDLEEKLESYEPGQRIQLEIIREGQLFQVELTLSSTVDNR